MTDVFISYSRTDMTFAKRLHASLEAGGLDPWIDWQDIPPSIDWLAEVYKAIEAADAFIFIISRESVGSEVCSHEVQHAAENNKRLIPIVLDDIDPRQVPPSIAALNWIFFRESDDFNQALTHLMEAIHLDQAWLKAHTRYQNRALEWERLVTDPGFLLHGRDLEEAETWLVEAANKDPQPTALQSQFLQAGRRAQNQRSRRTLTGASLALIITVALGIVAWTQRTVAVSASAVRATAQFAAIHEADARATAEGAALEEAAMRATAQAEAVLQRQEAEAQRITASSRQLTAEAMIHLKPEEIELALLLAVAGTQMEDTQEARASLLRALLYRPHLLKLLYYDTETYGVVTDLAFSFDSKTLGGRSKLGSSLFAPMWDIETGRVFDENKFPPELGFWDLNEGSPIWGGNAVFDRDQTILAVYEENLISVYDAASKTLMYQLMDPYGPIISLAFNPQGTILANGDRIDYDQGKVLLWDMDSGQLLGDPLIGPDGRVSRLQFNTDGSMLVAIGRSKKDLYIYESAQVFRWLINEEGITPQEVISLEEPSWNVLYDPYTENLIAEYYGEVQLYSLATGEVQGRAFRMDPPLLLNTMRKVMSPNGQYLAANCTYGRVFLYDLVDRISSIQAPLPATSAASAFAYSSDGEGLFVASCDSYEEGTQTCSQSKVDLWDSRTFSLMQSSVYTQDGAIHSMFIGEDRLLTTGKPTIFRLSLSTDLTRLAYINDAGQLSLWDYQDSTSSTRILLLESFTASDLAFSPDGSMLAVAGEGGVLLLSAEDGQELERLWENIPLRAITFDSKGDRLFAGGADGSLYAWDLTTGESITEPLKAHSYPITGIAIQPNDHLLVSGDAGGYLALWDGESLKTILDSIQADPTSIRAVSFDPTGDTFTILSGMGVSVWQARLSAWQEKACQIANRDMAPEEWSMFLGDLPYQHVCIQEE